MICKIQLGVHAAGFVDCEAEDRFFNASRSAIELINDQGGFKAISWTMRSEAKYQVVNKINDWLLCNMLSDIAQSINLN